MPEIVEVPLSDLLFDLRNPRMPEKLTSQQEFALAMAKQRPGALLRMAKDILEHGLDPTTIPAVIATDDQHKRYTVLEGNRRVLALKALETPALIAPALSEQDQRKLTSYAERYTSAPAKTVSCVLFDDEDQARHWIELRHTGANEGVGLVEWGSDEQDRFRARQGARSPEGQIIDFVERHGSLSAEARVSKKGIRSSLKRLISTPQVRERLGIDVADGSVTSLYPKEEMARVLSGLVEDLKTGKLPTKKIYDATDRVAFAKSLSGAAVPKKSKKLPAPVTLENLAAGKPAKPVVPRRRRRRREVARTSLIPRTCQLNIDPPRINAIYNELGSFSVDQYPNACSVLFRVFVELSVDEYLKRKSVMTEAQRQSAPLAKRMKSAASHLRQHHKIDADLLKAVEKIASSKFILAAATVTMNQYVHNQYVFPQPTELRVAWDEIQPFVVQLWA
jgi:hypothetical protein